MDLMKRLKDVERRIVDLYHKVGRLTSSLDSQVTIPASGPIDTTTGGGTQDGKTVVINNGATAVTYTVNATDGFNASFLKTGTAAVTFAAGAGRTLVPMDGLTIMNGVAGSRATILSAGTIDYLYITNY